MQLKIKVWIEKNNKYILGEGIVKLLNEIKKSNSLKIAAQKLKMSYRQAWGDLKEVEKNFNLKLIETKVGGSGGGETKITSKAEKLIKQFSQLEKEVLIFSKESFKKIFKDFKE